MVSFSFTLSGLLSMKRTHQRALKKLISPKLIGSKNEKEGERTQKYARSYSGVSREKKSSQNGG